MSLSISQSVTAMGPGLTTGFLGVGGTGPYAYAVLSGGAGGTINPVTGLYTSPAAVNSNPAMTSDTIQVTDSLAATATTTILVTDALGLFCDVIQNQMGLSPGRVYFWDQKINEPKDAGLFIAVSVLSCRPFGNSISFDGTGSGLSTIQSVNMQATLGIDIISRGPEARIRKEEVILALNSVYAQSQQESNSFYIGKLPAGSQFVNLSVIDGAAIPYRFNISVNIQYFVKKTPAVPYLDTFSTVQVNTNP